MNILVCVSVVFDTMFEFKLTKNKKIDDSNIQFILNPIDEFCLSKIISLKAKTNINVSILNIGNSRNDNIIRKCLAMGADKAFRIEDSAEDSFIVAKKISKFIVNNNFDIIVFGNNSIDFNGNCVHGIVSGLTNIPFISNIIDVDIDNSIFIKSEFEDTIYNLEANMPIIISGKKNIIKESDIIIPNIRGLISANQKQITVLNYPEQEKVSEIMYYEKFEHSKECKFIKASQFLEVLKENNLI